MDEAEQDQVKTADAAEHVVETGESPAEVLPEHVTIRVPMHFKTFMTDRRRSHDLVSVLYGKALQARHGRRSFMSEDWHDRIAELANEPLPPTNHGEPVGRRGVR